MNWWCAALGLPWSWEWRAYPGVWLFVGTVAVAYLWAIRWLPPARLAADDAPTGPREVALFFTGVGVLWMALDWPLGQLAAGYLLSARTLQYLLLVLVAPPLMLLGLPRWLLRRMVRGRIAFRIARLFTRPLVPLLVYNAVLVAMHLPPTVDSTAGSQLAGFALDVAVIGSGLVFWWPALARLPELRPMGYPARIGYLLLSVFLPTVPASFFTYARFPIYPLYELAPRVHGIEAVMDQQIAGLTMKVLGGLILFGTMSVMFFRWHRLEERQEAGGKEAVVRSDG